MLSSMATKNSLFHFYYYFHVPICYHDFQIPWTKISLLLLLADAFTPWRMYEIMGSLLQLIFWFLWNTREHEKVGKMGRAKFVLQKYCTLLLSCLQLYPPVISMKMFFCYIHENIKKVGKWGMGKAVLQKYLKWHLLLARLLLCFLYFRSKE